MADGAAHALAEADSPVSRVLVVDDEAPLRRAVRRLLVAEGFNVLEACGAEELRAALHEEPELVLLDLQLGRSSGAELIGEIRGHGYDTEIIVMTGYATIDSAVACMRAGVFDYVEKPFQDGRRLVQTVRRALEHRALRVRNRQLEGERDRRSAFEGIVVASPAMRRIQRMILDLAQNQSNVLIQAESGTGKERIARAIHRTSLRAEGPFVPVDCGALPEGLAEGELFGYEAGAFTGAVRASVGLFRAAAGGTLFLDEVGELSPSLQAKLLRVLQEREVRPLGAATPQSIDVRIVAATHRDLAADVHSGRFRQDLFYRLRVVEIRLPPLRERPEEIPLLALHFLNLYRAGSAIEGIEPEAIEALISRPWDGNVRELENTIEAAVALARGPRLTVADLGLQNLREPVPASPAPEDLPLSLEAYERRCLEQALARTAGDVRRAASLLGIGRSTLYRKLRRHGLSA
ncbi:MAG: sigma-54-dependent transcriptional regulator [Myxococcota bacterium]